MISTPPFVRMAECRVTITPQDLQALHAMCNLMSAESESLKEDIDALQMHLQST